MMLPGYIWVILISIIPMFGIIMAFQNYNPGTGILGSEWVGLYHFKYLFTLNDSAVILKNTIIISFGKIVGNIIIPLLFALLLNEVRIIGIKRSIQTIVYLPYFVSWVILSGILLDIFGYVGPVNHFFTKWFETEPIMFFGRSDMFRSFIIGSDVWKTFGYNAIIYLAALTGIDPALYEAAAIDGAGRFRRLTYITLPAVKITAVLLMILSLGNVLNAGFEQIFNLYNPLVYSTADIIDTWVYRTGLLNMQYSLATAVGLFKSAVGFVLIVTGYYLANQFTDYRIF